MELLQTGTIVLCVTPADWRWGIRSLTSEACTTLGITDFCNSDVWAVFINRHHDAVRILHYSADAVTLFERRLRKGNKYPKLLSSLSQQNSVSITREELQAMLLGRVGPLKLGSEPRRSSSGSPPVLPTRADTDAPAA